MLKAEGLNAVDNVDAATLSATTLVGRDVVVLGESNLTAAQVTAVTNWVTAGGNLIALRPDKDLTGLLGLTDQAATLAEGYMQIDTTPGGPGAGLTGVTMQYHGTADRYGLNGATSVATLYSTSTTATANPAVTLRSVGGSGGQAAAFTYDLARSIVLTRQGNPAWAGQNRDGIGRRARTTSSSGRCQATSSRIGSTRRRSGSRRPTSSSACSRTSSSG